MRPTRVAVAALARTTFDIPLAAELASVLRQRLSAAGLSLEGPGELITDLDQAECAAAGLAANPPDLLIILQATFADSGMAVALAERVPAPLLLWALPETRSGGRLRLNSLCGINLAGHALSLRGYRYEYVYAEPADEVALAHVAAVAAAGRVRSRLRQVRLGVLGQHPDGFDSCHLDAPLLAEKFGVHVDLTALSEVFRRARTADVGQVAAARARLNTQLDNLATLEPAPLNGSLGVYAALKVLAEERRLDGLAVRCWPEFFTELGCAACGAMSMLSDEQVPCSCEADVNGTLTQIILQELSGQAAFGSDIVAMDFEQDTAVLWHCGLAPLSMADSAARVSGGLHSNRKLPLVMDFPLKPGRVTIARLSRGPDGLRLVLGGGEMLAAPPAFSGTSGTLRFDHPVRDVLDTLMHEGLEHHVSLTYGDYIPALAALAKMLALPVLRL